MTKEVAMDRLEEASHSYLQLLNNSRAPLRYVLLMLLRRRIKMLEQMLSETEIRAMT